MPDVMGFHRISIYVTSNMPGIFSLPQVEVQLVSEQGNNVEVEIGELVGAIRMGDLLTLPVDKTLELLFKLRGYMFKGSDSFPVYPKGNYSSKCQLF
jgi:hypothetical protein